MTPTPLNRPRDRSFWNNRIEVGGEHVETLEEKVQRVTGVKEGLPAFLKEKGPTTEGFMRVVDFIGEKRAQGVRDDDELRMAVGIFVAGYADRVRQITRPYWEGMQAAGRLFRGRPD